MFKVKKGFTVIEIAIVIAIVVAIAGVWYVSKNKAGADIRMPGIGKNGTPPPVGNTTPPKIGMGMGTVKGQIFDFNGKPPKWAAVTFSALGSNGTCKPAEGFFQYNGYPIEQPGGYYYKSEGMIPGSYCAYAWGISAPNTYPGDSGLVQVNVSKGGITTRDFKLSESKLPGTNPKP